MSFLFWVIYNPSQVGQKTVVHNTFLDAVLAKNANKPILASPPPPLPPFPTLTRKGFNECISCLRAVSQYPGF